MSDTGAPLFLTYMEIGQAAKETLYNDAMTLINANIGGGAGAFAWQGDLTPPQITSTQHDYAPTGLATAAILRLSTDASRDLTGITGGVDGRVLLLLNVGSTPLVLKDDTGSTAVNRFQLSGDVTLGADEGAFLWYDSTGSRWRMVARYTAAAGGSTQGRHTLFLPAAAWVGALTFGAVENQLEMPTNRNNYRTLSFANAANVVYAHTHLEMPKAWNRGALTFVVHWTADTVSTNGIVWGLQGQAISDNDNLSIPYGTAQEVTDNGLGVAYYEHRTAESSPLTVGGTPAVSDLIALRLYRDPTHASDTLAVTVDLLGVTIFYVTSQDTDL